MQRQQGGVARQVYARIGQQRLVTRQRALELRELRLEGPRVHLRQQVSLAHELTFLVEHVDELAIHAAEQVHRIDRHHRPQTVQVNADAAQVCARGHHAGGRQRRVLRMAGEDPQEIQHGNGEDEEEQQPERPAAQARTP